MPADASILRALLAAYNASQSLKDYRTFTFALLQFAGCLRWSETVALTTSDVELTSSSLYLFIRSRKNDQHKVGSHVFIAASSGSDLCPVSVFERYCCLAGILLAPSEPASFIFRNISGQSLNSQQLSYSAHIDLIRAALVSHSNHDPRTISTHSFRSGAATVLVNHGVAPAAIKEFGGWRSEASMDRYCRRSAVTKLQTSRAMRL